jgi:hypothetical protein
MRYQIFSDESGHSRFRSIGVLSGKKTEIDNLRNELIIILEKKDRDSIEFKKIDGDKNKEKVAIDFVEKGIEYCVNEKIRMDILTWDTQDSRHEIIGRDDIKNFQMMYYKILRWVKQCWKHKHIVWDFYPDENSAVDWKKLMSYLQNANLSKKHVKEDSLFGEIQNLDFPRFQRHDEVISDTEPLTQVIDLFTGFARYSFEKGKEFLAWRENIKNQSQLTLFGDSEVKIKLSRGDTSKFKILQILDKLCKDRRMGVSIERNSYLYTFLPSNPLNFWFYEPQHEADKAPIRKKKMRSNLSK